jgi:hypothetical protein
MDQRSAALAGPAQAKATRRAVSVAARFNIGFEAFKLPWRLEVALSGDRIGAVSRPCCGHALILWINHLH